LRAIHVENPNAVQRILTPYSASSAICIFLQQNGDILYAFCTILGDEVIIRTLAMVLATILERNLT